jgi:signal peptidase I
MKLRSRFLGAWREWRGFLLFVSLMLVFRSSFATMYYVPTASMQPTIVEGDRVFVNKLAYDFKLPFTLHSVARWADPQRGDVVVLLSPADGVRLIKRVVGVPGDTLELRRDQLYVNGSAVAYLPPADGEAAALPPVERDAALFFRERLDDRVHAVMFLPARAAMRSFGPVWIPAGQYFVMGDNRDDSRDSRYIGLIPRTAIVGRATAIVFSLDPGRHYLPRSGRLFRPLD